jgi:hypothetical protein
MADSGDDDKSGFSDAFKRACAKFGVARYLYRDGVPAFVREREPATEVVAAAETQAAEPVAVPDRRRQDRVAARDDSPPRSGRALFAWTKEQEQRHEVGLLKYLNGWAKLQDFPGRMVDWNADQVALAYAEGCRKLQAIQPSRREALDEALSN